MQKNGGFMKEKMKKLLKKIGHPFQMFNEDGTYQGCFYPIQVLYPEIPRYKLVSEDVEENYNYGMAKIREYCDEVSPNDLKMGDIITAKYNKALHVAVYYEFGKMIHVFKEHSLQIGRLKLFSEFQSYRVR